MTKPTLDDLRRSAEFAGKEIDGDSIILEETYFPISTWHPPSNPAQDRELLHAIREAGWQVHYNPQLTRHWITHPERSVLGAWFDFNCFPNDFLTLAASRLQEMKDE
jgi:hypothetical protein